MHVTPFSKRLHTIRTVFHAVAALLTTVGLAVADEPRLPGVGAVMQTLVVADEIAGAVTMVVNRDGTLHLECTGLADIASERPMAPDTLFWIASMTKPVTGVAVAMLIDEGKLAIDDPVERYVPEFATLKTLSGKPAHLTIRQILTHTSGLGEAPPEATRNARELADLVPVWLAAPMKNEPGEKWVYTQSGINLAGRIVEIVSGLRFDAFLQERLFDPLGMVDTTFYPTDQQRQRLATPYARNRDTGKLEVAPPRAE
jgi:CubicO group peptidase (beta-lactamase class C family)